MYKFIGTSVALAAVAVTLALAPSAVEAKGNRMLSQHERFCSNEPRPFDQAKAAKGLRLNDAQTAAFKDYEDTRLKSFADMKTTICSSKADFTTFPGRLAAHQLFLEAHVAALKMQAPKLVAFYNSLDAQQKVMFDETREDGRRGRGRGKHNR